MDTNNLIILLIIIIFLLIIFIIRKGYHKNTTKIITSSPEELIKQMQENNFPEEMIENFKNQDKAFSTYTTSTMHKVTYVNGKKVSEEKKSTHSTSKPLTNCPNCGAKIKHKDKDYCEYCHTILTNKK